MSCDVFVNDNTRHCQSLVGFGSIHEAQYCNDLQGWVIVDSFAEIIVRF